jgi:hypothetical protein
MALHCMTNLLREKAGMNGCPGSAIASVHQFHLGDKDLLRIKDLMNEVQLFAGRR